MNEISFLQSIRRSPDDLVLRLAFADWLEEHGEADRAEFVRVQCELDPIRAETDNPRQAVLLEREEQLRWDVPRRWLEPLQEEFGELLTTEQPYGAYFRGGVPEVLALPLEELLDRGDDLLGAVPSVREIAVFDVGDGWPDLARCGDIRRLEALEIVDQQGDRDLVALLASPAFRRLRKVRLWDSGGGGQLGEPTDWPAEMRLELVEVGGAAVISPGWRSDELDGLAARFAQAGRSLELIRPFLDRFPLKPLLEQNLHPGRTGDGKPVLFGHGRHDSDPCVLAYFDEEGNFIGSQQRADPGTCRHTEDYPDWLAREYGYRPEMIWMREFVAQAGLGIQWCPRWMAESEPNDLWSWLREGKYVINWCNRPWASRFRGEITDT
jgi:uncharacterized protein (TIGR02996 family)